MLFRCQHGNNNKKVIYIFHIFIYLFDVFKMSFKTVDEFYLLIYWDKINTLDNIQVWRLKPYLCCTYITIYVLTCFKAEYIGHIKILYIPAYCTLTNSCHSFITYISMILLQNVHIFMKRKWIQIRVHVCLVNSPAAITGAT